MRRGSRQFFARKKREAKTIKFKCPHCGQRISGARELVGKSGKCPRCLAQFVLEAPLLISPPPAQSEKNSPPTQGGKGPAAKKRNPLLVPLICTSASLGLALIGVGVYFFHDHNPAGFTTSAPAPVTSFQATPVPVAPSSPMPVNPNIAASTPAKPEAATPMPGHAADDAGAIALAQTPPPLQPPKPGNPNIAASAPAKPAPSTPTPAHAAGEASAQTPPPLQPPKPANPKTAATATAPVKPAPATPAPAPAPVRPAVDAGAIMLSQTPPVVQRTIQANIGNGKVTSISKRDEEGVGTYEVSFTKNGQTSDLHVGEDGRLLSILIALAETPPAVRTSIQTQLGRDTLVAIEKTFEVDETSYVVDITAKDGRASHFTIGDDGALFEREIALNEAPAPVQKTVAAQMGDGTLTMLTKVFAEKVTFDADFTKDGKDGVVTIAGNGQLLSVKITLAEAPAPVQRAIVEYVGAGKIRSVWKSFEKRNNVLPFKVESMKDGKYFNFSVAPDGRFLGLDS
jgi:hypothetical protein